MFARESSSVVARALARPGQAAPTRPLPRSRRRGLPGRPAGVGLVVLVGTLVAACGQKGPLTLPAAPAAAAQPASAPVR